MWTITASSKAAVQGILSGRTRWALKQAGLPLYVDDYLSPQQRQQRKRLEPLRQRLRGQGVKTRWAAAALQKRVQNEQGSWAWQVVADRDA